jgi:hypothetical protein
MERHIGEAARSAAAMENLAQIQRAAMQQWVSIENWKTELGFCGPSSLQINFDIDNPTSWPLTLDLVEIVTGGGNRYTEGIANLLPPRSPHYTGFTLDLTSEQLADYQKGILVINVICSVAFRNAFDKQITQKLRTMLVCGAKSLAVSPERNQQYDSTPQDERED